MSINNSLIRRSCLNCGISFMARRRTVKVGNGKFCSRSCSSSGAFNTMAGRTGLSNPNWKGGLPQCLDCGKQLSAWHVKRCRSCARKGLFNPNWLNGKTPLNKLIRHSAKYKEWRIAVFKRDDFTCVKCGERGGNKQADHIKPFASYPDLRFEISNGQTLCVPCHRATETYGAKFLHKLIGVRT